MSVYKSKRSTSAIQYVENARQLQVFTIKNCVKFPKRYTYIVVQKIANLVEDIDTHVRATAVTTYAFTPPTLSGWAHGVFSAGNSPSITFMGKILGKLPTFESGKSYEFDVYSGNWIIQEVVTQ